MRLWVWRHFRIEVPEDWEMLQFSRDGRAGRCAFADRYQFRLEVHWHQVEGVPDVERLASGYLARLKLDASAESTNRSEIGLWQGVEGRQGGVGQASRLPAGKMPAPHQGGLWTSRFARYVGEESCLVELVLLWPEGKDDALQQAVVQSVAAQPGRADGLRRWKAFGMDALAMGGLSLEVCKVEPGRAGLVFGSSSPERRETFGRAGWLSEWLDCSVRAWLQRQTLGNVAAESESSAELNGHAIETLSGLWRPRWFSGLLRSAATYEAAAWICPADGRLYHVSTLGPATSGGVPLAGGRLVCCEGIRSNP